MVLRKIFALERNFSLFYKRILFILQHINTSEFRICLKELYADQHDPVNVSYAVLAGGFGDNHPSPYSPPNPPPPPPFAITIARDILFNKKLIIYGLFISRCFDRVINR